MPIARRRVIWKSFIDNELQTPYPMPYPTGQEYASRTGVRDAVLFCRDRNYRNVSTESAGVTTAASRVPRPKGGYSLIQYDVYALD